MLKTTFMGVAAGLLASVAAAITLLFRRRMESRLAAERDRERIETKLSAVTQDVDRYRSLLLVKSRDYLVDAEVVRKGPSQPEPTLYLPETLIAEALAGKWRAYGTNAAGNRSWEGWFTFSSDGTAFVEDKQGSGRGKWAVEKDRVRVNWERRQSGKEAWDEFMLPIKPDGISGRSWTGGTTHATKVSEGATPERLLKNG